MQNKQYKYENGQTLTLEIKAEDFIAIRTAIGQAIDLGTTKTLPEKQSYVSVRTGEVVKKPAKGQVEKGEVVLVQDMNATFDQSNLQISYDATKVTVQMLHSNMVLETLFKQHVEQGIAKEVENESV